MYHKFNTLRNSMLIAMPNLNSDYFAESVILLCEHDESGAMGLVINRPLDLNVKEVMQQMKITTNNPELRSTSVLSGGPVKTEKGFVLHFHDSSSKNSADNCDTGCIDNIKSKQEWNSSLELNENLSITTSNDIIHAIAQNKFHDPYIFTLGYCEWEPGQLEEELVNNDWLIAPLDLDVLFNVPHMHRWRECTYNIGIEDISNLSNYTGHA